VSRSSWFAIRAPLSARRATLAKIGSFLIPLALWALLCAVWVPEVVVTEQGEGRFKVGDRVGRAEFDEEKARLLETRTEPKLVITDQSIASLRSAGVPESVLTTLEGIKGTKGSITAISFASRDELADNLSGSLDKESLGQFKEKILDSAEKEEKPMMAGDPSNVIWLPSPLKVAKAFYHAFVTPPVGKDPWLHESLWHSCRIIFWGFILSAIIGVPLGIFCGTFDLFAKLTEPFVDFIRYMPAPAFGVLVVAILGIYDGPKIAIIWIGTFFQMVLVVANTTRQCDESLLEAAQTLGATKSALLTKVILPGILPHLYNDMRILIGWAWTYLIVAELIGTSSGISYFISQQGRYRHFENVYAGIIMIGLIGLTVDQLLAALARYLFPWMPRSRGSGAWAAFFSALAILPRWVMRRPPVSAKPASAPVKTS
jgi:NitT/TauT family transport system permease protein